MNCFSKVNIFNTLLPSIVFILLTLNVKSQGVEETAIQLFEEENYTEALSHFEELNRLYPGENIFQYYYGVCLTETGRFGNQAHRMLLSSAQGQVPSNVFFYIGKNYHAQNDFETAEVYYKRFGNYARRRDKRALNFDEIMKQLANRENPFVNEPKEPTQISTEISEEIISDNLQMISDTEIPGTAETETIAVIQNIEPVTKTEIPETLREKDISFILTPEIKYLRASQFKTSNGLNHFIEGWEKANELQKTMHLLETYRVKYNNESNIDKRQEIAGEMLQLELNLVHLKADSDENFLKARISEMEFWNGAPSNIANKLKEENDSILKITVLPLAKPVLILEPDDLQEVYPADFDDAEEETEVQDPETTEEVVQQTTQATGKLVYKVQIGAYSRGLPAYVERQHSRLSAIRRIESYTTDKGVVVYTIGELTNFDDALRLQNQIRQEGINDAFVVAFYNGKRITLSEAREINKE